MTEARRRLRRVLGRVPGLLALARLVVSTIRICMRYRVTGLASEAGFFALLSLPPLILGLVGGLAYVASAIGPVRVDAVIDAVNVYASQFLTEDVIKDTLLPTIEDVAAGPRFDLLSLGFVLSLWSGSRALNVFVDTISIMYGQSGVRGIVRTRALSFSLYTGAVVLGGVANAPWRVTAAEALLEGQSLTPALAIQAAELAIQGASPLAHNRYKVSLTRELARRALLMAANMWPEEG